MKSQQFIFCPYRGLFILKLSMSICFHRFFLLQIYIKNSYQFPCSLKGIPSNSCLRKGSGRASLAQAHQFVKIKICVHNVCLILSKKLIDHPWGQGRSRANQSISWSKRVKISNRPKWACPSRALSLLKLLVDFCISSIHGTLHESRHNYESV